MHGDLLLVVCGGAAAKIVGESGDKIDIDKIFVDSNVDNSTVPLVSDDRDYRGDADLSFTLALDNADAIKKGMKGKRLVFIFSMLGGGAGTGMVPAIIGMAKQCGCLTSCILGIPWSLESERREKALEALWENVKMADRTLVLDADTIPKIYPDIRLHNIMTQVANTLVFTMNCLADMANGPFFSTFSQRMYTFAYTSDLDPEIAVDRALGASMFKTDPTTGKVIVTVSSRFGLSECEVVLDKIVSLSGIMPDIVKREDSEDTKVLVFLPVEIE